jgi:gliding motility-associated-like protein
VVTPNNDGKNDLFKIEYNGDSKAKLLIWDRWGKDVFSSGDIAEYWNPESLNTGIYYYQLLLNESKISGWIQIIK